MRYRYGVSAGDYQLTVTGQQSGDYGLEVHAADAAGELLRSRIEDSIEAGAVQQYVASIPGTSTGNGSLKRVRDRDWWTMPAVAGVAGIAGSAAGLYMGRRGQTSAGEDEGNSDSE